MDWAAWLASALIVLVLLYILSLGVVEAYFNAKERFIDKLAERMRDRDGQS